MKLRSLLFVMLFALIPQAWSSEQAVGLNHGDLISFYNPFINRFDYGNVQSVNSNGVVIFRVRVIHNESGSNYITYENYQTHVSQLGISVTELNGFKPGQKVCFEKEKGKLKVIFTNGTAMVMISDFFGAHFGIFERAKVVSLSQLGSCK